MLSDRGENSKQSKETRLAAALQIKGTVSYMLMLHKQRPQRAGSGRAVTTHREMIWLRPSRLKMKVSGVYWSASWIFFGHSINTLDGFSVGLIGETVNKAKHRHHDGWFACLSRCKTTSCLIHGALCLRAFEYRGRSFSCWPCSPLCSQHFLSGCFLLRFLEVVFPPSDSTHRHFQKTASTPGDSETPPFSF